MFAHDPQAARELLADAGFADGLKLSLIPSPGIATTLAEIAQEQWKEIGVDLEIMRTANIVQDLFQDHKADMGSASVVRGGLEAISTIYRPGALGDLCNYEHPRMNAILDELGALAPTDPAYTKLWRDAQQFIAQNALSVYGVWLPAVIGYDADRLGNVKALFLGVTAYPDFLQAYVKKQ